MSENAKRGREGMPRYRARLAYTKPRAVLISSPLFNTPLKMRGGGGSHITSKESNGNKVCKARDFSL